MSDPVPLTHVWRGEFLECVHTGHAVVCDAAGGIVEAWGDPDAVVLPRSSAKMIQALPLIESGAARAFDLSEPLLALACASHNGAAIHTDPIRDWLDALGLHDGDFLCGPQMPKDRAAFNALIRTDSAPCQVHNNCSGKHAGFLTLARHLGAGPDYVDPDHPVQMACLDAFEEMTGETSAGFAIDGCSAPNFACSMGGMARAMARFAAADGEGDGRARAAHRLWQAMVAHPALVAGERRACTELMRAVTEPVALKTGAEGYFTAILPGKGLGIALKIADGATRAANCTIAALLVRHGVLDPEHPAARRFLDAPILNRRGVPTGRIEAHPSLR